MSFGKKAKDLKAQRRQLEKKKGSNSPIKFIGKEDLEVRFLEEMPWMSYTEAYSPKVGSFWPQPNEDSPVDAPEVEDAKESTKYLVNALDVKTDKVIALKLPVSLVDALSRRAEKKGSITDCDFELFKTGEGLDTVYGYETGERKKRNLAKYRKDLKDLEELLVAAFNEVWGDDDEDDYDDEDEDEAPRRRSKAKPKRRTRKVVDDDDEDEEDLDDEEEEDEDYDDEEDDEEDLEDDEEEEDDDDEDDEEEYEEYTEEELGEMTLGDLRAIARENGIKITGLKKADLIEALMDVDA